MHGTVAINPGAPPRCEFPGPSIALAPAFLPPISPPAWKHGRIRRVPQASCLHRIGDKGSLEPGTGTAQKLFPPLSPSFTNGRAEYNAVPPCVPQ